LVFETKLRAASSGDLPGAPVKRMTAFLSLLDICTAVGVSFTFQSAGTGNWMRMPGGSKRPLHVALPGVLAVNEAVDRPQVGLALDSRSGQTHLPLRLLRLGPDGLFAVFGLGCVANQAGMPLRSRLRVHPLERFEKARHLRGVIARLGRVLHTQGVRPRARCRGCIS